MDKEINRIINKALDCTKLEDLEIAKLFMVEPLSEEASAIELAGRRFSRDLLKGKAEIHGQIGIDIGLCPRDCKYCSFAVSNKVFTKNIELETQEIVESVQSMERAGANAIYIMATAKYNLEKFLRISKAVKENMISEVPLIANVDDLYLDHAKELVDVGYKGVYHAIRMGEGEFTNISVERRIKSIMQAKEAGLVVGMCVEPIGPEHTIEELVEKTVTNSL